MNPFQDIFELISMTFLPKNVEGISNFKKMEQQPSFQIPINLNFLKFANFQDFPGQFRVNFQDIFELIFMTFLPKNVEGISHFNEMEQQSSFQIPINLNFLKFINFQDFPGQFARFQDIPGHFFISRTFQKVGTLP